MRLDIHIEGCKFFVTCFYIAEGFEAVLGASINHVMFGEGVSKRLRWITRLGKGSVIISRVFLFLEICDIT